MEHGRRNIIAGGIVIFIAAIGGFALGFTVENIFKDGFYALTLPRMLMKAGHTHGMPMAFYNLIIGVMVDRLALMEKDKKYLSILALGAFIMPLGLLLRGLTGGSMTFIPVVMIGAICFLASAAIMLKGAIARKTF